MGDITSFRGEYFFLSNFFLIDIWGGNRWYPSVEHAYVAQKSLNEEWREMISKTPTPEEAKKLGRKVKLRANWEDIKFSVMRYYVRQKFLFNPELCKKLMDTGDRKLVEGNTWGDTYWGVCNGKGENNLGKLLMEVRDEANKYFSKQMLLFS